MAMQLFMALMANPGDMGLFPYIIVPQDRYAI